MFSVALIGPDGAGKTTVAKELQMSFSLPIKYIYMGVNAQSSNFALPTSRLILYFKLRSYRKVAAQRGIDQPEFVSTHHLEHRRDKRGTLGAILRLCHRLTEAWFRQIISWYYQFRGYIVLYDRHFLFDVAPAESRKQRFTDRLHHWLLNYLYPKPDLIILLEAPPEILFSRKGEASLDYLQRRNEAFLKQGEKMKNFVRVDANQPLDKVLKDVTQNIAQFYRSKKNSQEVLRQKI